MIVFSLYITKQGSKGMSKADLVVKSNRLNTAIQNLSLSEIRLIQLAIIDAREHNRGLSADKPLRIEAKRYAEAFDVSRQTAYEVILNAEKNLFERRFSFINDKDRLVKSRWVQRVEYIEAESAIEVIFTYDVVNEITRLDGAVDFFTKYLLKQTSSMTSMYSVRLYELLVQWKEAKRTPIFEIGIFREQLGIGVNEYQTMSDFKKRVLKLALKEINDKSDLIVDFEQHKKGKSISGFSFTIKTKKVDKPKVEAKPEDTFIQFTAKQLSTFSNKLANLPALGSNAPIGSTVEQYATMIAKDLLDEAKQKKYHKHLEAVGYKAA